VEHRRRCARAVQRSRRREASPDQPGAPNNTDAGATETAGRLWFDIGVHRAGVAPLQDTPVAPLPPDIAATMLRARGEWQPTALPGLRLGARVQRPGNAALQAESRSSLVFSADYTLARDAALGERLAGTRLFWREAPRLTLLGEGAALDARAAYRRIVGIDVPEAAFGGSPDGSLYAQWRSRSVADRDDSLLVLGWRRGWRLTERWTLQGRVEQASPLDGPNPVRSTRLGARLRFGGFPVQTFVTDVDLIQSSVTDSAYVATRYTTRLGSNWLTIWRFAVNHQEPHDDPHTGTTDYKLTATFGWREPSARRWALLSRYTFAATNTEQAVPNDRRAHIGAIGANYAAGPADLVSVRLSRRWERQDSRLPPGPRVSDLAMVRWTHELTERWSLSGHAGQRHDDDEGSASTYGAEIGLRVSRRVVLALGYNPRGFKDNELQIDERLRQGFTLRLRFSIEAVLGRWLDAPSPPEPERSQD
jgi:hypothetical protein